MITDFPLFSHIMEKKDSFLKQASLRTQIRNQESFCILSLSVFGLGSAASQIEKRMHGTCMFSLNVKWVEE